MSSRSSKIETDKVLSIVSWKEMEGMRFHRLKRNISSTDDGINLEKVKVRAVLSIVGQKYGGSRHCTRFHRAHRKHSQH